VSKAPRPAAGAVRVTVHVQPGASATAVAGPHGDAVKIRVAAPPIDNAANLALVEFLAERLGVPKHRVRVVRGATGRRKIVEIAGVSAEAVDAALAAP